jgi:hypothetical protein
MKFAGVWASWTLVAALPLLQACNGELLDGEGDGEEEETETVVSALGICDGASTNVHSAGANSAKKLSSLSTHFCWVTKFSGNFNGQQPDNWGDTGQGLKQRPDGFWWLENNAYSGGGNVEARCVPKSCFHGDGVNDQVSFSVHNISAIATADGECDADTNNTAWWGDAATMLHFWPGPGNTNGSGENVQVIQSTNAFTSSGIQAADCYHDGLGRFITGRATSLFVGTPNSGQLALFTGAQFSTWGDNTLNLGVFTDEAICYFTKVYGKFRGAGESVRIYQVASGSRFLWYAKSAQGGSGEGVKGSGRCFYFNQSNK